MIARLDDNNKEAALRLKRDVIQLLEEAAALNPDGYAPVMLRAGRRTLQRMEKGRGGAVRKAVHYQAYLHRMDSSDAMRAVAQYADEADDSSDDDEDLPAPRSGGRRQLFDSGDWAAGVV